MQLEILELPRAARNYRFEVETLRRLKKLGVLLPTKTDTAILEDAIAHLLSALERDEKVSMTIPSEVAKSHKRASDAR